jgi:hypothetical protein
MELISSQRIDYLPKCNIKAWFFKKLDIVTYARQIDHFNFLLLKE